MTQLRVVDLFAGWGGFTEGIEQAGHRVVWAANHWEIAVEAHAINHPSVEHVCQDLHQANFCVLPEYDVLVASPACQGHSSASQSQRRSYHDEMRATAWAVVLAAEATMPRAIIVENVPDFRRWGPQNDGRLYRRWKGALEDLGYHLSEIIVDATAHGVPQRRKRLFIIGTRDPGFHYRPTRRAHLPEPAFGPAIEWGEGDWRKISQVGPGRREKIYAGIERFGRGSSFVGQDVTGHRGIPVTKAIRTITCQDQWFVVRGGVYRPLTIRETARAMGFPDTYSWPESTSRRDCIIGLGNAVCPPVARDLIAQVAEVLATAKRPAASRLVAAGKKAAKKGRREPAKKRTKASTKALPPAKPIDKLDLLELASRVRAGSVMAAKARVSR